MNSKDIYIYIYIYSGKRCLNCHTLDPNVNVGKSCGNCKKSLFCTNCIGDYSCERCPNVLWLCQPCKKLLVCSICDFKACEKCFTSCFSPTCPNKTIRICQKCITKCPSCYVGYCKTCTFHILKCPGECKKEGCSSCFKSCKNKLCKHHFCKECECNFKCPACNKFIGCNRCAEPCSTNDCKYLQCQNTKCPNYIHCTTCKKKYCRCHYYFPRCAKCNNLVCLECLKLTNSIYVRYCQDSQYEYFDDWRKNDQRYWPEEVSKEWIANTSAHVGCKNCKQSYLCPTCFALPDAWPKQDCEICQVNKCVRCMRTCPLCKMKICLDCKMTCNKCKKAFCCIECHQKFWETCPTCIKPICYDCCEAQTQCSSCEKYLCCGPSYNHYCVSKKHSICTACFKNRGIECKHCRVFGTECKACYGNLHHCEKCKICCSCLTSFGFSCSRCPQIIGCKKCIGDKSACLSCKKEFCHNCYLKDGVKGCYTCKKNYCSTSCFLKRAQSLEKGEGKERTCEQCRNEPINPPPPDPYKLNECLMCKRDGMDYYFGMYEEEKSTQCTMNPDHTRTCKQCSGRNSYRWFECTKCSQWIYNCYECFGKAYGCENCKICARCIQWETENRCPNEGCTGYSGHCNKCNPNLDKQCPQCKKQRKNIYKECKGCKENMRCSKCQSIVCVNCSVKCQCPPSKGKDILCRGCIILCSCLKRGFCGDCIPTERCNSCGKVLCSKSKKIEKNCGKNLHLICKQCEKYSPIPNRCRECTKPVCLSCDSGSFICGCLFVYCALCKPSKTIVCEGCKTTICQDCSRIESKSCSNCSKIVCKKCAARCLICNTEILCLNCLSISDWCPKHRVCYKCINVTSCATCDLQTEGCLYCIREVKEICDNCKDPICRKCINKEKENERKCLSCSQFSMLCSKCKSVECNSCKVIIEYCAMCITKCDKCKKDTCKYCMFKCNCQSLCRECLPCYAGCVSCGGLVMCLKCFPNIKLRPRYQSFMTSSELCKKSHMICSKCYDKESKSYYERCCKCYNYSYNKHCIICYGSNKPCANCLKCCLCVRNDNNLCSECKFYKCSCKFCSNCNDPNICSDCKPFDYRKCEETDCKAIICKNCPPQKCMTCSKFRCVKCTVNSRIKCELCKIPQCLECYNKILTNAKGIANTKCSYYWRQCGKFYCPKCILVNGCSTCKTMFCTECKNMLIIRAKDLPKCCSICKISYFCSNCDIYIYNTGYAYNELKVYVEESCCGENVRLYLCDGCLAMKKKKKKEESCKIL